MRESRVLTGGSSDQQGGKKGSDGQLFPEVPTNRKMGGRADYTSGGKPGERPNLGENDWKERHVRRRLETTTPSGTSGTERSAGKKDSVVEGKNDKRHFLLGKGRR